MKPKQRRSRVIAIIESYTLARGLRYQGAFAEQDEETGYSAFALRQYDARFGRWTSTDPYGQYWSPYVGMGACFRIANAVLKSGNCHLRPTEGVVINVWYLRHRCLDGFNYYKHFAPTGHKLTDKVPHLRKRFPCSNA